MDLLPFEFGSWGVDPTDPTANLGPDSLKALYPEEAAVRECTRISPPGRGLECIDGVEGNNWRMRPFKVRYHKDNGFRANYVYNDESGTVVTDAYFIATVSETQVNITGALGRINPFDLGTGEDAIRGVSIVVSKSALNSDGSTTSNQGSLLGSAGRFDSQDIRVNSNISNDNNHIGGVVYVDGYNDTVKTLELKGMFVTDRCVNPDRCGD